MPEPLPPRFPGAPPLSCSRLGCTADATYHVIWTPDAENGLCCDEHVEEVRRRWVFWAIHPYTLTCSTPGAVFIEGENRCVMPDGVRYVTAEREVADA